MINYKLFWVLVLILLQPACTLFLIGGAGVGGYYVADNDRPFVTIIDDASITTGINAKYIADKYVNARDIDIDTENGRVTLHGHVRKSHYIKRAIRLAKSVSGVKSVIARLSVIKD